MTSLVEPICEHASHTIPFTLDKDKVCLPYQNPTPKGYEKIDSSEISTVSDMLRCVHLMTINELFFLFCVFCKVNSWEVSNLTNLEFMARVV